MHNPKLKILRCDNSTPLNRNLIPRFEETREKNKDYSSSLCTCLIEIDEI
jgi:hypothetical protein